MMRSVAIEAFNAMIVDLYLLEFVLFVMFISIS
jgi:hypothetical protein